MKEIKYILSLLILLVCFVPDSFSFTDVNDESGTRRMMICKETDSKEDSRLLSFSDYVYEQSAYHFSNTQSCSNVNDICPTSIASTILKVNLFDLSQRATGANRYNRKDRPYILRRYILYHRLQLDQPYC